MGDFIYNFNIRQVGKDLLYRLVFGQCLYYLRQRFCPYFLKVPFQRIYHRKSQYFCRRRKLGSYTWFIAACINTIPTVVALK